MQRTYSRKGARRISRSAASSPERDNDSTLQRKRRRIQVEVVRQPDETTDGAQERPQHTDTKSRAYSTTGARTPPLKALPKFPAATSSAQASRTKTADQVSGIDVSGEDIISKSLKNLATSSSPTKTTGLAKRMLRRARTDPAVSSIDHSSSQESGTSANTMDMLPQKLVPTRTQSIIDLTTDSPGPSSQPSSPSKARSLDDISSPARPVLVKSNVRTYAGRSRSFLVALPSGSGVGGVSGTTSAQDFDDTETLEHGQEDEAPRESYTDLRLRWGVDNSEDDTYPPLPVHDDDSPRRKGKNTVAAPHLPPGMMNDLKSISELRSKGEVRRFLDEMGYLFEGLVADAALGVRRGSALEIVTKLCDADFARRAKAGDFLGRAWDALRAAGAGNGDKVLDSVLVFFVALVARDPVDLPEISAKPGFVPALYRIMGTLDYSNDPLWLISAGVTDPALKRAGIGRAEATTLKALHKMVRKKSSIPLEGEIISNRLLVSRSLSALPSYLNGPSCLPDLLRSLSNELRSIPARVSAYSSGLPLFPALGDTTYTENSSLSHIDHCLRLLDTSLLGQWADGDELSCQDAAVTEIERNSDFGYHLLSLITAVDIVTRNKNDDETRTNAHRCMESAFRVLINLSHENTQWCDRIADQALPTILRVIAISHRQRSRIVSSRSPPDSEADDDSSQLLDRMCLALGLLTNLVQTSAGAKSHIRGIVQCPECPGSRSCIVACECSSALDAPSCLTRIYVEQCGSDNDLDTVVRGHMAVLFGLLMERSAENQQLILASLPGTNNRDKLRSLVDNAREFLLFYVNFAKKVAEASQEVEDDEDDERERIEGGAQNVLHDVKGETVANNVVRYLEEMYRDTCD